MPTYRVRAPDGKVYRVQGPKNADPQTLFAFVDSQRREREKSPIENIPVIGGVLAPVADIGLNVFEGAASRIGSMATALTDTPNNKVSKFMGEAAALATRLQSAQARQDVEEQARIQKEAEGKGILPEMWAAVRAFGVAPLDTTAEGLGSMLPAATVGAATALSGGSAPAAAAAAMAGTGLLSGAGEAKGEIYSAVLTEARKAGVSEADAKAMAEQSQSYSGGNLDMIALAAAIEGVASSTGASGPLARAIAGRVAQRLGKEIGKKAAGSRLKTAAVEAGTEMLQGGQTKLAGNIAAQREGFDVDTWRGVAGQATLEGITGGVLGGALGGGKTEQLPADQRADVVEAAEALRNDPTEATRQAIVDTLVNKRGFPPDIADKITRSMLERARASQEANQPSGAESELNSEPSDAVVDQGFPSAGVMPDITPDPLTQPSEPVSGVTGLGGMDPTQATTLLEDDDAISALAEQRGMSEAEVIEMLQGQVESTRAPYEPPPVIPPMEQVTPQAQISEQLPQIDPAMSSPVVLPALDRAAAVLKQFGVPLDEVTIQRLRILENTAKQSDDFNAVMREGIIDMVERYQSQQAEPELAPEETPAPEPVLPDEPISPKLEVTPVGEFVTAKGSAYAVNPDGTTTRNKAPRPEHPGEQGPQPKSDATFYAPPAELEKLAPIQAQGGPAMQVILNDQGTHAALKILEGPNAGKLIRDTVIPVSREPDVGLSPVELWKDGTRVHFGNEIVDVKRPTGLASSQTQDSSRLEIASPEPVQDNIEETSPSLAALPPETTLAPEPTPPAPSPVEEAKAEVAALEQQLGFLKEQKQAGTPQAVQARRSLTAAKQRAKELEKAQPSLLDAEVKQATPEEQAAAQAAIAEQRKRSEGNRDQRLNELQDYIHRAHPRNAAYQVVYEPDKTKPYRVKAGGAYILAEEHLDDLAAKADDLPVYDPNPPASAEEIDPSEDVSLATTMLQDVVREVTSQAPPSLVLDEMRDGRPKEKLTPRKEAQRKKEQAPKLDNLQRQELLAMLQEPEVRHDAEGKRLPPTPEEANRIRLLDQISEMDKQALDLMGKFRNAKNDKARKAAEAELGALNIRIQEKVEQLTKPVRQRMREMIEEREDEVFGAKQTIENLEVQKALGKKEGKSTAAEEWEQRKAKADIKQKQVPRYMRDRYNDPAEAQRVDRAIRGMTADEVVQWLTKAAPDQLNRTIASRVLETMRRMQKAAGIRFEFHLVGEDDPRSPLVDKDAKGMSYYDPGTDTAHVWINDASMEEVAGTYYPVILHEFVHAVTAVTIQLGSMPKYKGTDFAEAAKDLIRVTDEIQAHFVDRLTSNAPLSAVEKRAARGANAFSDPYEVVAWAMSDPDMQEYLASIPYPPKKGVTFWGALVDAVRKVLRLSPPFYSALDEVMRATDNLLNLPPHRIRALRQAAKENIEAAPAYMVASKATTNKAKKASRETSEGLYKAQVSDSVSDIADGIGAAVRARSKEAGPFAALKEFGSAVKPQWRSVFLGSLPTSAIRNLIEKDFPVVGRIADTITAMQNMKTNLLRGADPIAKAIERVSQKKSKLATMSIAARINEVDPRLFKDDLDASILADPIIKELDARAQSAKGNKDKLKHIASQRGRRERQISTTFGVWQELAKEKDAQKTYLEMLSYFEDMHNAAIALLDDRLDQIAPDPEARKKLKEIRAQMEDLGPPNLTEAQKKADPFWDIPQGLFPKAYIPFVRNGKFWLRVAGDGKTGRPREFYTFKTAYQRDAALKKRAKELGVGENAPIFNTGNDIATEQEDFRNEDAMMQRIFEILDKAKTDTAQTGFSPANLKALTDDIYQVYLMTAPERSIRRQMVHSDDVAGMSTDMVFTFSSRASAYANQLSKLAYAPTIRREIEGGYENLKADRSDGRPREEVEYLRDYIREMEKRAEQELNPTEQNNLVSILNRGSFMYFLTGSATALIQMTSIPIRVMPRLWSRYGFAEGNKIWLKYMNVSKSLSVRAYDMGGEATRFGMPNLGNSAIVKGRPHLQKIYAELDRRNILATVTDTIIQTERATPRGKRTVVRKGFDAFTQMMGIPFTAADNIARQMTAMMAAELEYNRAKKEGASNDEAHERAVDTAVKTVSDTQGDYGSFERPRLLKSDWARAAFLFKMFSIKQTQFMFETVRTLVKSRKDLPPGEKAAVFKEAMGVLTMAFMFGGLAGMPLYTLGTMALSLLMQGLEDDDEELARLMKQGVDPAVAFDADLRFRYEWLPSLFGKAEVMGLDGKKHRVTDILINGPLSELPDVNIGSRTTIDLKNLWLRDSIEGDDTLQTAINFALSNIAGGSLAVQLSRGVSDFYKGEIGLGMEKALPAFFKSWLVADRMSDEGMQTRKNDAVMTKEEFSEANVILQALGFQPMRYADQQRYNFNLRKGDMRQKEKRNHLLAQFNKAVHEQDAEAYDTLLDEMQKYNARYPKPGLMITEDTLKRSWDTYVRNREMSNRGVTMTKRDAPYRLRGLEEVVED